jgi:hypothetical protein
LEFRVTKELDAGSGQTFAGNIPAQTPSGHPVNQTTDRMTAFGNDFLFSELDY